ncbi:hypothetical protein SLS55_007748 [Diplodia seriata]|uniref:Uncharacterized protein n=1 Tax=Diplodia seriata TaxID=420778 RepID=A0ABR3C8W2_9PEZI
MPTYKNITLSLRSSAHETAPLLEFPPPPHLPGVRIEDARSSTATVYVPASPGLTFWIAYHIKPPAYLEDPDVKYFLFKLYMEGRHVVTWAVGEEDGWKGKTMFGLFENAAWRGGVEKRAFAFAAGREGDGGDVDVERDHEERFMEVRVLRASARKRVQRETPELMETEVGREGAGGIKYDFLPVETIGHPCESVELTAENSLVNAGCLKKENPKRFYEFVLIDSLKEPFAKFRYYYRSVDQLETLGVIVRVPQCEDESEDEVVTDSGNGYESLDLSFLAKNDADTQSTPLSHGSPHTVASERLNTAVSPLGTGPPSADREVADLLSYVGLSTDVEPPRTPDPPAAALPKRSQSKKSSPWSPPRSSRIAMRNSAVVPMTVPDSPTEGSVADAALVGALSGQEWLKRTPSPDRTMYRQFDSPAPGASRRGRKSPTGRLKEALKRAWRRGDS